MNNFYITGIIASEPEKRVSQKGTSYINKLMVTMKGNNPKQEPSTVEVTCFGQVADRVASYEVGDHLFIAGRLSMQTWEYQGKPYSRLQLVASTVVRLDPLVEEGSQPREHLPPDLGDTPF